MGDEHIGHINYAGLNEDVVPGNKILIDDGLIELEVEKVDGTDIVCRVLNGGELGMRKGVNVPNVKIKLPALTEDVYKRQVCVMLDHGEDLDYVKKALDLGFSAVMFDGSSRPYEENVRLTKETVRLAGQYGASVEAEIGVVTGHEGKVFEVTSVEEAYTCLLYTSRCV